MEGLSILHAVQPLLVLNFGVERFDDISLVPVTQNKPAEDASEVITNAQSSELFRVSCKYVEVRVHALRGR